MADICLKEVDTLHFVTFRQAQHLPAKGSEATVKGIKVVDQEFDLGRMELHAFDLCGQFFAQLLVFLFLRCREIIASSKGFHPIGLEFFKCLEVLRDTGKTLNRIWFERSLHLGQAQRIVFVIIFIVAL